MKRMGAALCAVMLLISAGAYAAGEAPGNPLALELGQSVEGETSRAVFYKVVASRAGMLVVSLAPEGADLDLAVMGPGGNPTVESRRAGMESEEATLQVSAGTEYLVRVTSASGRFGHYRLKAEMRGAGAMSAPARSSTASASAPARAMMGMPGMMMPPGMQQMQAPSSDLPMLPLGYFVPDQIDAEKTYRLMVPMGMAVSVVVRPVMGDPSLEVRSADGTVSGSSARQGMLPEEVEIPAGTNGWFEVKVTPGADGAARFFLGTSPRVSSSAISPAPAMMGPWGMGMTMDPSMYGWGMMDPSMMYGMQMQNPYMMYGAWGQGVPGMTMNPWMMQNPGWGWR